MQLTNRGKTVDAAKLTNVIVTPRFRAEWEVASEVYCNKIRKIFVEER